MKVTFSHSKTKAVKYILFGSVKLLVIFVIKAQSKSPILDSMFWWIILLALAILFIRLGIKEFRQPSLLFSISENGVFLHQNKHKSLIPWNEIKDIYHQSIGSTMCVGFDLTSSYKKQFPELLRSSKKLNGNNHPDTFVESNYRKTDELVTILNEIRKAEDELRQQIIRDNFKDLVLTHIQYCEES